MKQLIHNGVLLPKKYEAKDFRMRVKGRTMELTLEQERPATSSSAIPPSRRPEYYIPQSRAYYERNRKRVLDRCRDYYQHKRAEILERHRKRNSLLKQQLLELLGGRCVAYGLSDQICLTFDHIKGGEKRHQVKLGRRGQQYYAWLLAHPDFTRSHIQLLCFNCNALKALHQEEFRRRYLEAP